MFYIYLNLFLRFYYLKLMIWEFSKLLINYKSCLPIRLWLLSIGECTFIKLKLSFCTPSLTNISFRPLNLIVCALL